MSIRISDATYEEIRDKLLAAGYDHAVDADQDRVLVDGIMLVRSDEPVTLKHLEAVEIRPGDTLVFTASERLSERACSNIQHLVTETLPGHKVLVLDAGMELGILREPPPPPPPPAYTHLPLSSVLLCEELGIRATETGVCPIHQGDGCLRVYFHSKEPASPEIPGATLDWRDKMGGS